MFRIYNNPLPNHVGKIAFIDNETKIESLSSELIMIDQLGAMEFSKNNAGWQRGAVSMLASIQTEQQAQAVLRTLQQHPAQFNLTKDTSAKDAFAMVRPRLCQMPTELLQFAEHLAKGDLAKLDDAYAKALEKAVKQPVTSVEKPVESSVES